MTVQRMDNVGIVVDDLPATIEFFRELGVELGDERLHDVCAGEQDFAIEEPAGFCESHSKVHQVFRTLERDRESFAGLLEPDLTRVSAPRPIFDC